MKVKKIIAYLKFFLILFLVFFIINFISGYFSDRVRVYIRQKAILHMSDMISETIQSEVLPNIDTDKLVIMSTNEANKVESIFINTNQINQIMADTIESISKKVDSIKENPDLVNMTLPMGIIVSDVLFNELGPNINIIIEPVGSVICDVVTDYQTYGINNTLFTVKIKVEVQFATIIPFYKEVATVAANIPIVVQVIQGEVPRYYYNNTDSQFIPHPIEIE